MKASRFFLRVQTYILTNPSVLLNVAENDILREEVAAYINSSVRAFEQT